MSRTGVFRSRTFRWLWSGNLTSLAGFHCARIAYPLLILALTGSPAAAGWSGFALGLPGLLLQLHAGVVVDRADRLRILFWCQIVGIIATSVAALTAWIQPPGLVPILVVAAFTEGSVYIFVYLAEIGAVRDVVAVDQRPDAFALMEAEAPIANLVGRAAGATLFGISRAAPFLVNAMSYVYCLLALSAIRGQRLPAVAVAVERRSTWRDIVVGLQVVHRERFLRASTTMIAGSNGLIQIALLVILVELQASGRPAWAIGLTLAAAGVGGIAGAAIASKVLVVFTPQTVYRIALWIWTGLLVPVALSTNIVILSVCWCGIGCIGVVSSVALTVYRVQIVPEQVLGRATATMSVVNDSGAAFGALVAGYLVSFVGTTAAGWLVLGAMGALALYAGRMVSEGVEASALSAP
ncbi:MFS transporter [Nocardia sp. NPDC004722]